MTNQPPRDRTPARSPARDCRYRKPLILFLGEEGGEIELALDEELEDIRIAKSLDDVRTLRPTPPHSPLLPPHHHRSP